MIFTAWRRSSLMVSRENRQETMDFPWIFLHKKGDLVEIFSFNQSIAIEHGHG
jgi:hypothetical protein